MQSLEETYHTCVVCGASVPESGLVYGPDRYAEDVLGLTREMGWRCKKCEDEAIMSSNFF